MAALNMREARKRAHYTQEALAHVIGSYKNHVSWLERGIHTPNEATRKKIESVLGDVDWFETSRMVLQQGSMFRAEKLFGKLMSVVLGMPEDEKRQFSEIVRKYFNISGVHVKRIKNQTRSHVR